MIHNTPINENSAEFIVFLRWLRDKWELEGNSTDIPEEVDIPSLYREPKFEIITDPEMIANLFG